MSAGVSNYPPGMSPCDLDGTEEQRPIDDRGMFMGYGEASMRRRFLQSTHDELDQVAAELRDVGEESLKLAVLDLMKRVEKRIEEVSR